MTNAIKKGVVIVKAAGNSGRDGPFNADVATAAGAITLASVGSSVGDPVDKKVIMSRFSSIGPVSHTVVKQKLRSRCRYEAVQHRRMGWVAGAGCWLCGPATADIARAAGVITLAYVGGLSG